MLYFLSVNGKVCMCKIHKFYYDTPSTNKTMAVRNEKCHFESEQQLISSITRNRYCFNYCKKYDTLMLVTSIQTACSKCPQTAFCMPGAFAERQYCCINLGLEKIVSSDRLHNVLHLRNCWWSALTCNIGTFQALHPIRNIPVD